MRIQLKHHSPRTTDDSSDEEEQKNSTDIMPSSLHIKINSEGVQPSIIESKPTYANIVKNFCTYNIACK